MKLSNEKIRKELIEFLEEKGVKNRFIAKKINASDTTISLFLKGQRKLSTSKLELLYKLIHNEK